MFVDLDRNAVPAATEDDPVGVDVLRTLPRTLTAQRHGLLLIRPPGILQEVDDFVKQIAEVMDDWQFAQPVAVLHHRVGERAQLAPVGPHEIADPGDWLDRARAIELEALLEFGEAIWRPRHYHYRLITGEHTESYVKVGDALRAPRDATVLASWLFEHVDERVGLVLDTGTLTPIAQAIELELLRVGKTMKETQILDQLSRTSTDVDELIDRASAREGRLLFVVSVSSSNSLIGRVLAALGRRPGLNAANVAVMVSKHPDNPEPGTVHVWTPGPNAEPLVPAGASDAAGCRLCRTPGKAPVVPISPMTFDALAPAQLQNVVPDIRDPADNRALWEAASRNSAITVESPSTMKMRSHRSNRVPMGIKLDIPKLLGDQRFIFDLRQKLTDAADTEGLKNNADLVLVPDHELEECGDEFDEFWKDVRPLLAQSHAQVVGFGADGDFDEKLRDKVKAAKSILVFVLGTVTGATLQRALVGIQDARKKDGVFDLQGYIVHARPASSRELQTMINSYGKDGNRPLLRAAWRSVLPDRSPLREEGRLLRVLSTASTALDSDAQSFLRHRFELCARRMEDLVAAEEASKGGGETASTKSKEGKGLDAFTEDTSSPERPLLLWGAMPPGDVLTPNSIYGKDLSEIATYVAVGSAMAARLARPTPGLPELRVFDMASMARSYYDPIILCCFLRWMRPHEAFWGWTTVEAAATAEHLINRAEGRHRMLLVPELLLAACHGKLTAESAAVVIAAANAMRDEPEMNAVRACLDVGLEVLKLVRLDNAEGLPA